MREGWYGWRQNRNTEEACTVNNRNIFIRVEGIPRPGGSKRPVPNRKTGGVFLVDDCKKNKEWRKGVAIFARACYKGPPLEGPLSVVCTFFVPRPKSHYRANGTLKPNAPRYPTGRPDATKYWRSTEDALTDCGVWKDDAQVVQQNVGKRYADNCPIGAVIHIAAWGEQQ